MRASLNFCQGNLFQDLLPQYQRLAVEVVGISNESMERACDGANSQVCKWFDPADATHPGMSVLLVVTEQGFTFPLLCDLGLEVSVAYGAAADTSAGKAKRIAVLVGRDGNVRNLWSRVDARTFPQTCLAQLK